MSEALDPKKLSKAVGAYHARIAALRDGGNTTELQLRPAFRDLLDGLSPLVGWQFQDETTTPTATASGSIRPDGRLSRNDFPYGLWEAKGPESKLRAKVAEKIDQGYPLYNILFENTKKAILYQHGHEHLPCDLADPDALAATLQRFFAYSEKVYDSLELAIDKFRDKVPDASVRLRNMIARAHAEKPRFRDQHAAFLDVCRQAINPGLDADAVDSLLIQHLLLHRLIDSIFHLAHFLNENAIAREIEHVMAALTGSGFDKQKFLAELDPFFNAIEAAARKLDEVVVDHDERFRLKQKILNNVYERFFQKWDKDVADTHGIVYTPQEIVDFMCRSVADVLQREFGKSLGDPSVAILDPCTGTGNFVVNLMRRIPREKLADAYKHRLFANEVQLLPYYIAALNIEHTYTQLMGHHEPFPGLCFVDTLDLDEGLAASLPGMFNEENTERVLNQIRAPITVIIGNPPYNVGQENENQNNKNRVYRRHSKKEPPKVDDLISSTYAKDSKSTNKKSLSDAYVKFFRWATDRLRGRDGIVCYVSNNSLLDNIAFDGMRKNLLNDFDLIYHLDMRGNVRENPKLSGTAYNVFGIQVGVGITLAVRLSKISGKHIYVHKLELELRKREKLDWLARTCSTEFVAWAEVQPDKNHNWVIPRGAEEYAELISLGDRFSKSSTEVVQNILFRTYSNGVKSNRDKIVYSFNLNLLYERIKRFIDTFNYEVYRYKKSGFGAKVDEFVDYAAIPWSEGLKSLLVRGEEMIFNPVNVRPVVYRPFTGKYLYFDRCAVERVYLFPIIFPVNGAQLENRVICVPGLGNRKDFGCFMVEKICDLEIGFEKTQCFPFYTYAEDGTDRRENITDWALDHFRTHYGKPGLSKWDIFHYVYAVLHHPAYRERFAEVLKKELPRVPLLPEFDAYAAAGRELAEIHVGYESVEPFAELAYHWKDGLPVSWRVERMRLAKDKLSLQVNAALTLSGIPPEVFRYRLGNRSALDWVIDQYQVDPKTGEDPNRPDDPQYIVNLVRRVVAVSFRTVTLVEALPAWPELPDQAPPAPAEPPPPVVDPAPAAGPPKRRNRKG